MWIAASLVVLVTAASSAAAQQASQPKRVGLVLWDTLTPSAPSPYLSAVRDGLRELGWVEGQNLLLEPRSYEGKLERIAEIVTELVSVRVDVIVTSSVPATRAVKQATATTPIVVASATDPAGTGLVAVRVVCGSDSEGGAASRPTDRAADALRTRHQ